jgi:hypothetical protein
MPHSRLILRPAIVVCLNIFLEYLPEFLIFHSVQFWIRRQIPQNWHKLPLSFFLQFLPLKLFPEILDVLVDSCIINIFLKLVSIDPRSNELHQISIPRHGILGRLHSSEIKDDTAFISRAEYHIRWRLPIVSFWIHLVLQ